MLEHREKNFGRLSWTGGYFHGGSRIKTFRWRGWKNSSSSIEEVFKEVQSGRSHYGVVPVENSTEGMVNQTLDCLLRGN